MMKRRIAPLSLSLLLLAGSLTAQLHAPRAAAVRYQDGSVHTIFGLHNNYVVGPALATGTLAAAFSDKFGFIADGASLTLLREDDDVIGQFRALEPHPVIDVADSAESAIAWLPTQMTLVHWNGNALVSAGLTQLPVAGQVTSVSKRDAQTAVLLVLVADGGVMQAEVSLKTGTAGATSFVPGTPGITARLGRFSLQYTAGKLRTIDNSNGSAGPEWPMPAASLTFERASSTSLHIASVADNRNWLLYVENHQLQLAELPPPGAAK